MKCDCFFVVRVGCYLRGYPSNCYWANDVTSTPYDPPLWAIRARELMDRAHKGGTFTVEDFKEMRDTMPPDLYVRVIQAICLRKGQCSIVDDNPTN